MTAKEKAETIVNTMLDKLYDNGSLSFKRILYARAVECAKVLVDEILLEYPSVNSGLIKEAHLLEKVIYWLQVRIELNAMQA